MSSSICEIRNVPTFKEACILDGLLKVPNSWLHYKHFKDEDLDGLREFLVEYDFPQKDVEPLLQLVEELVDDDSCVCLVKDTTSQQWTLYHYATSDYTSATTG